MCDYSLHNVASRPAKAGDRLVTTEFLNTYTRSFSAVGEPNVAVCLLPGTELAFKEDVRFDHLLGRLDRDSASARSATGSPGFGRST
jgi:hypothetical protein